MTLRKPGSPWTPLGTWSTRRSRIRRRCQYSSGTQRPYADRVRDGIARALAIRGDAAFAWETLVELYRDEPAGTDAKEGLAVALAAGATTAALDDLVELVADPQHGQSRILLIKGISRSRSDKTHMTLVRLAHDPIVGTEIQRLLKRRKN